MTPDDDELVASLAICVFCGAKAGSSPAITSAARRVGELIGARGHELVYGAGGSGLMGEVAWSAWRNGADVTGYAPRFIYEQEQGVSAPRQALYITYDMFERKRRMMAHADAFIALAGGYGTLDEVVEVISQTYLSRETTPACLSAAQKPLILLNTDDFWSSLMDLADCFYKTGFAELRPDAMFLIADSPDDAVALAEQAAIAAKRTRIGVVR
jgi:cytokinin riboside 5'-monophosphate phosphoribohydrolase